MGKLPTSSHEFAIEHVVLTVNDLEKVTTFYQAVIGLERLEQDGEIVRLGADVTSLIELRQDRHARQRSSREAGLSHTAFLLPSRSVQLVATNIWNSRGAGQRRFLDWSGRDSPVGLSASSRRISARRRRKFFWNYRDA